ncbi:hypothetical protein LZK73_21770 [Neorhizobium galegae]|nr:hypothetical protein LZK73_21770 [Neorhizobium galegae]
MTDFKWWDVMTSGATGTILGIVGLVAAFVLGFNQHWFSHLNRTRYFGALSRRLKTIRSGQEYLRRNIHNTSLLHYIVQMSMFGGAALANLIMLGFIGTASARALADAVMFWFFIGNVVVLAYFMYMFGLSLSRFTATYFSIVGPERALRDIRVEVEQGARASNLRTQDRELILSQVLSIEEEYGLTRMDGPV